MESKVRVNSSPLFSIGTNKVCGSLRSVPCSSCWGYLQCQFLWHWRWILPSLKPFPQRGPHQPSRTQSAWHDFCSISCSTKLVIDYWIYCLTLQEKNINISRFSLRNQTDGQDRRVGTGHNRNQFGSQIRSVNFTLSATEANVIAPSVLHGQLLSFL